ncbi:MAG: GNAT family N-acetyltransferase [Cellulosilyticum sp.]|nr:GNAT family N-acetyltransferase [Cellulosilyticum sp.]
MHYKMREIEEKDNKAVEKIIRTCLIEFGANHEGTAWADPNLGQFSKIYNTEREKYWVVEDESGRLVGGVGIGSLEGIEDVCELQKMYCLPEVRGMGIAQKLMNQALEHASGYYTRCYLETLENMVAAQKFYEKNGFQRICEPLIKTEHFACDVRYIKALKKA